MNILYDCGLIAIVAEKKYNVSMSVRMLSWNGHGQKISGVSCENLLWLIYYVEQSLSRRVFLWTTVVGKGRNDSFWRMEQEDG